MIRIEGTFFKDELGRTLMLRGVNLGGSTKVPYHPNGASHNLEGFFDHQNVSFVGRPFPLSAADEHFARLRAWGLTFLRFLITWEAIEHTGPGIYDEAYLDYVRKIVQKANEHGISMFIDPHQDMWSRFSGGDGAPGWTLEAAGLDMAHFAECGAAIVHATHGDPFPRMIWPTNCSKLATATMFTLFFGGNDFAPQTRVNGEPIQEYLQRHYISAIQQMALRLKDLPNVIGYDTLNEPLPGYIGWTDLKKTGGTLTMGECPSPFQAMLLGSGQPQAVEFWQLQALGLKRTGTHLLNPSRTHAWKDGHGCIWQQNGVWDFDSHGQPVLLRPDHFTRVNGKQVDFNWDYYRPFANRFAAAIRDVDPHAIIFLEGEADTKSPRWTAEDAGNVVYAPHWYDSYVLAKSEFTPLIGVDSFSRSIVFGPWAIRRSYARQLARLKRSAEVEMGGIPTLIGEFGIPFDLENKKAYRTGNFQTQIKALDRTFRALEANLLSGTLWNYTADNSNQRGDQWNGEDLSIFSPDQHTNPHDINSGGRALQSAVRPYPRATAGEPLHLSFDPSKRVFQFTFRHDPAILAPTEIFLPDLQYPRGYHVKVSDGTFEKPAGSQILTYCHTNNLKEHSIRITPMG